MKTRSFLILLLSILLAFALFACDAPPVSSSGNAGSGEGGTGEGGTGEGGGGEAPCDHTYFVDEVVEPTCKTGGYTLYACACGDSYRASETDPLPHTPGDFVTVTPAGATAAGLEEQRCTVCGELLDTREIAPTGSVGLAFEWKASNNTYTVIGIGSCTDTELVIPSRHEGRPVKLIGKKAFENNKSITSVYIPSSVMTVMEGAFYGCTALEEITVADGVLGIGNLAFEECHSLTEVYLPDSVSYLGAYAFGYCKNLKTVRLSPAISEISDGAFSHCEKLERIDLPPSATRIGQYAFMNCTALAEVTMGDWIGSIDECAFLQCASLKAIELSDRLTRIETFAFAECEELASVSFGESLAYIGKAAFWNCRKLGDITLPRTLQTIENDGFDTCMSMTHVTFLGNRLSMIGKNAFSSCGALAEITYGGTKANWEAIEKELSWMPLGILTIHCTNGDIRIAY